LQRAINLLARSAPSRIDGVFDGLAVFKDDFSQIALIVVCVAGGLAGYGVGLARQIACGVVRVAVALPRQQLVFVVVFGDEFYERDMPVALAGLALAAMKEGVLRVGETPRVTGHAAQCLAGGMAVGGGWHGLDGLWRD